MARLTWDGNGDLCYSDDIASFTSEGDFSGEDITVTGCSATLEDNLDILARSAALPEGLLESELFGHVRGAFTGAVAARVGRFEAAHGGTIFLDEVGEITPHVQSRLLRVLQEHEFEPVGSNKTRKVDIRVIAATNRDLAAMCESGQFRGDLYYRLAVLPVRVSPLRERASDVPLLVEHLCHRIAARQGHPPPRIAPTTLECLAAGWTREFDPRNRTLIPRSAGATSCSAR